MKMTYEEAKAYQKSLEEENKTHSKTLESFEKSKSAIGLTPDHVKATPEWQTAKREFNRSFAELRKFNAWFVKTFKKESTADRRR